MEREAYQDYGEIKEEIERRYRDKRKRLSDRFVIHTVVAGAIAIGGMVIPTIMENSNPYRDAKRRYDEISNSLNSLEDFREKSDISSKLSYLPDKIKPYLPAFDNEKVDKAIQLVKEDITVIENSEEFRAYEERDAVLRNTGRGVTVAGLLGIIFGTVYNFIKTMKSHKKERLELLNLKHDTDNEGKSKTQG